MSKNQSIQFNEGVETETGNAPVEDTEAVEAPEEEQADNDEEESDSDDSWDRERAMAKIRKANAEARAQRSRAKKAEEQIQDVDELRRRNGELEATILRMEVAAELGLPAKLATRLAGSTREELIEDAEALLDLFKSPTKPARVNAFDEGHQRAVPAEPVDLDKMASEFMS